MTVHGKAPRKHLSDLEIADFLAASMVFGCLRQMLVDRSLRQMSVGNCTSVVSKRLTYLPPNTGAAMIDHRLSCHTRYRVD